MRRVALLLLLVSAGPCLRPMAAQEAGSGIDFRATFSGQVAASSILTEPDRSGSPVAAGFRAVLYPTVKFSDHWTITGAWQLYSHPYFVESFSNPGYGEKGGILQATLNYSRVSDKGSVLVRVGQLSTAFGSFLLHYDDADNALVNIPLEYGYYYAPISSLGVVGAQIDATRGKWDGRAEFANSSPANPRSLFAHDQYGNWAGGGGYTIRQGLRVGVSGYRGPYLDRQYAFFFPGEANPNTLPAHALGLDVEWAHGHWTLQGELQKFVMPYAAIPTFRERAGYVEVKRVLHPRWYVAARNGYTAASQGGNEQSIEVAAGFRPANFQLLKIDYELDHYSQDKNAFDKTFLVQYVVTLHRSYAGR
jgi:hypothetical protein